MIPIEIFGEHWNAARKRRRGRENRSRRQIFGFHVCLPRRIDGANPSDQG
jgi:hypothetical protein